MKAFVASFLLIMLHFITHVSASEPRLGSITTLELNKIKNIKSDPFIYRGSIERGVEIGQLFRRPQGCDFTSTHRVKKSAPPQVDLYPNITHR